MKLLKEIKDAIDYQQSDDNFIEYLRVLNVNGILIFNDTDISEVNGEFFASENLYGQIISVYGDNSQEEEIKIG